MSKLKPNFTQIPNILFDDWLIKLSGSEIKVLLYVMRRTYGFQKNSDNISVSQICNGITKKDGDILDKGTGLSNRAVITAIERLVEYGVIVAKKNTGVTTNFSLDITSEKSSLVKKVHRTSEKSSQELVKKVHTQKKVSKESLQKKESTSPKPESKYTYLLAIPSEHISYFTSKYDVSSSKLKTKGAELHDWIVSKGKEKSYKNFKAFLENAVRKDFGEKKIDPLLHITSPY